MLQTLGRTLAALLTMSLCLNIQDVWAQVSRTFKLRPPVTYTNGLEIQPGELTEFPVLCDNNTGGPFSTFTFVFPYDVGQLDSEGLIAAVSADYGVFFDAAQWRCTTRARVVYGTESGDSNIVNFSVSPGDVCSTVQCIPMSPSELTVTE